MNRELSSNPIAQRHPLPLDVPLPGLAVLLTDGRIADQPPVHRGERLKKPGRSLFGARAEAVLFAASTVSR